MMYLNQPYVRVHSKYIYPYTTFIDLCKKNIIISMNVSIVGQGDYIVFSTIILEEDEGEFIVMGIGYD